MKKIFPLFILVVIVGIFFKSFFQHTLLPIPSDTIVGLYNPFRDFYAASYPRGIPFKNFLITDPIRQQYVWRNLAISIEKSFALPLWNPYTFAGSPLLANFQSAALYPLNILFFFLPFSISWSVLIILEPLLGGIFMYLYLRNLKVSQEASILGTITFIFSGFSIAWMEWNTVLHVLIWLPLILFIKDKLLAKWTVSRTIIFIFAECAAILGGHVQILFYVFCVTNTYLFARIFLKTVRLQTKHFLYTYLKIYAPFLIAGISMYIITAIQWIPTLQFILLSARDIDQTNWQIAGWFIPWQHLIQFIAPDFFGNPTTLNYWGTWNYGELVGYVGIVPLICAIIALFFRRDKKTLFFGTLFFISLLFALPSIIAQLPFIFHIPFLSTAQPTRLLSITDFSLAVLSALGLDTFMEQKKSVFAPLLFLTIVFSLLWGTILAKNHLGFVISVGDILTAKHNLIVPSVLFTIAAVLFIILCLLPTKKEAIKKIVMVSLVLLTIIDLVRFGWKFLPFTPSMYLFPQTTTISFLQKNAGIYRIMENNAQIFPPNFSTEYRLQSVDGYDPLYLLRYGELVATIERNQPNIQPPFGFNRIITPENYTSPFINLLGVKYVLSLSDITNNSSLKKVSQEGQTRIYENTSVLPRAFFVKNLSLANNKHDAITILFQQKNNLAQNAVVENYHQTQTTFAVGAAKVSTYKEGSVTIRTENASTGFLLLTDTFYPTWHALIDTKETPIYQTDYNFRGIIVPAGSHIVTFTDRLF